ncbi:galactokinase [Acetanaerobacterium elongatum]|uniref:Galactokinase n=1 Tax=Acetanaerobacterium elongatum TaxID=258515 RepID=A0A1H0FGU6_9FIRM|nr:galactokinase family protein [Acetanaerobacterium elongatum]SDN94008.1 galactokinase [Acetanaerobacterium elongatum]
MLTEEMKKQLQGSAFDKAFGYVYCTGKNGVTLQKERYTTAVNAFEALFGQGREAELFSAPGRTEIGGNHTDHQHGRVLAAAVNLDVIAVASKNSDNTIRIKSEGYDMDVVSLDKLAPVEGEKNKAAALIRGVAARFAQLGYEVGGFDAYTSSSVLKGSGLSSSAAFEVLVGTMLNHLFNSGKVAPVQIAQIGQYAENNFFGKPCGLMDQTASAVGGFVTIDFADPVHPVVEKVGFDFAASGYALCIVNTGGNHADLTPDYASVSAEMKAIAAAFNKEYLNDVDEAVFFESIGRLRGKISDRAILRAMHFFADNARVLRQIDALNSSDFEQFKQLVLESGRSSYMYLQNVFSCHNPSEQGVSLALAISERVLAGKGAWRVHGGGFAGTIQAFVPVSKLQHYKAEIEAVMGEGSCFILSIRPVGGVKISPELC